MQSYNLEKFDANPNSNAPSALVKQMTACPMYMQCTGFHAFQLLHPFLEQYSPCQTLRASLFQIEIGLIISD
jgi:hypothetical protein